MKKQLVIRGKLFFRFGRGMYALGERTVKNHFVIFPTI